MEEKDVLYYSDFIYHIEHLAGLTTVEDKETNERIIKRKKDIEHNDENGFWYELSEFEEELFEFTMNIAKKVGEMLQGPSDLNKYPKLVKKELEEYYRKKEQQQAHEDLVDYIERITGLKPIEDVEKFNRIEKRVDMVEHQDENGGVYYTPSDFAIKLYNFALTILKMDEFVQKGPKALSNYPELVKERLNSIFIRIADDYSKTPGARYISDGDFSGEDFRNNLLEPKYLECLAKNKKLVIVLDGGYGYPVTFLEETFGGLVRKGYSAEDLLNNMVFISNEEPKLIEDITTFILEEGQRLARERKQ